MVRQPQTRLVPRRTRFSTPTRTGHLLGTALAGLLLCGLGTAPVSAQTISQASPQTLPNQTAAGTNRPLQLAADSPFRDPDVIYLEADELINDEQANVLTAIGEVEGRYQDRTLRANRVDYNLETGLVLASGDVVLIDATGDVQYADKLELSDELQAGTAANFTARLANGGTTMARFVTRDDDGQFELFNATYTACEICENSEGETGSPTWRLRARRVRQDEDTRTVQYKDAVLELFGLPVFYTPYLAHPDPSRSRASGLLTPTIGISGARGAQLYLPYYWAVDDYTEATITPRIYSKVNPLLGVEARRRFHTGELNFEGSLTYGTQFDRNGDPLDDPALFIPSDQALAPDGPEVGWHAFVDGYFRPSETWSYGYTVMLQSDDNFLARYGLSQNYETNGLVLNEGRRNTTQAFIAGQGDNFRISALAVGFRDLNTRFVERPNGLIDILEDDDELLPIVAPKVQGEYYLSDPALGGRLRLFGDATYLTRDEGNDYGRASAGAEYSKTVIAPGGVEVKPFAWGRFDQYDLDTATDAQLSFGRTVGQAGVDVRYPFIKPGKSVDWIVEPRLLYTESFGDADLANFIDPNDQSLLFEDGISPEFDAVGLFEPNKADGFDFFQEGRRFDVGARVGAKWTMRGQPSEFFVFAGRSFADGVDDPFAVGTGLSNGDSDYVGEVKFRYGRIFNSDTRLRFDPERDVVSRIDTRLSIDAKYVAVSGRYFKLNSQPSVIDGIELAPPEEVSGRVTVRPFGGWEASYSVVRDLDRAVSLTQQASIGYRDDCTLLEFFVSERDFAGDALRNDQTFGLRLTLATLGGFGSN